MQDIIIGCGEVGRALLQIFPEAAAYDPKQGRRDIPQHNIRAMHICFPYSDSFIGDVQNYKKQFSPQFIIVHSSVPIGTCDKLSAVHSPVRGVHPHLEKGIRTFVKYFSGLKANEAAALFREKNIICKIILDTRTTEALKLWDTTQYGIMILLEKEIHKFCRDNGVDFETVYADANRTYYEGYSELDMVHVTRPALMHVPGKIGGHCVVENAALLNTPLAKLIIETNKKL